MGGVFISYRRDDSVGSAGRLYDDLRDRLGAGLVFRDIDGIELGADFLAEIVKAIEKCDVLLAVIGRGWLESKDKSGNRRLDTAGDIVCFEISSALQSGKMVIPILIENTTMPMEADLPDDLRRLASRNALAISDLRWDYDVGRLVLRLGELLPPATASANPAPPLGRDVDDLDVQRLAATVVPLLVEHALRVASRAEGADDDTPDATSTIWKTVTERFDENRQAAGALDRMRLQPESTNRQGAVEDHLVEAMQTDRRFATLLRDLQRVAATGSTTRVSVRDAGATAVGGDVTITAGAHAAGRDLKIGSWPEPT